VIDEAQAYTEAQDAALSPLNSAAPTGSPQTILMGTPPLLIGGDKGLIFSKAIENFKKNPQIGACLHQWSAKEIGDPNDKDRWYKYNPSLGYQLLESALEKDALTMSPDSFAREHLGFMPLQSEIDNRCISESLWDSCSSEELKPEGKTAYGVKFSADGATVALCGAVISDDGMERISLIDCRGTARGVQWLADWLNERSKKASCVVIDGRNGVDVLIDKIKDTWKIKNSIVRPTTKEVIAAASLVINELSEKRLTWYEKQQILRESAITAVKRPISGGWGFGGDNSTPIEAAALALYGAKTSKRNPNKSMRFG
jgi:hypothetical protein